MNVPQWNLVRHYTIGITIGLVLGLATYFIFTMFFLNEDQLANSNAPLVQDPQTEVKQVSQAQSFENTGQPQRYELVEGHPQTVWKDLQENNQIHIGRIVELIETVNAWVAQDGISVFNKIQESIKDPTVRSALLGSVIHNLTKHTESQDVFYEAVEVLDDDIREEVLWILSASWAQHDPVGPFAAATTLNKSREREELRKMIVSVWAHTNHQSLESLIDTMPEVVRGHAEFQLMVVKARNSPTEAVEFLSKIGGTMYEFTLSKIIAEEWSSTNIDEALKWVESHKFSNSRTRNQIMAVVLQELSQQDMERAVEIALEQPVDQFDRGAECFLVEQIAATDIERAMKLLSHVREGGSALHAYMAVGNQLALQYDFERAVELGEQLQKDHRNRYYDHIFRGWARESPSNLFKKLNTFKPNIQSRAALNLIESESGRLIFTEETLTGLKTVVN